MMNRRLLTQKISKPRSETRGNSKKDAVKSPDLYDAQKSIWEDRRRFNILLCGRRFGKTILILFIVIYYLLQGKKVAVFGPNFKSIKKIWNWIEGLFRKQTKSKNGSDHQIVLKNNGLIHFWSLNNKAKENDGRGEDYDVLIYEETQSINSDILRYHWQNVARATLSDRRGSAWFIGTPPNSRKHYFYNLIARGSINNKEMHGQPDIKLPELKTWGDFPKWTTFRNTAYSNPHIDDEEIDDAKRELPELIFLQEYMAICVEYAESPFFLCAQTKKGQDKIFTTGLNVDWRMPVWISFDFNKNPMAATIWQKGMDNEFIWCIKEFGAPKKLKVNIHYTCALIREYIYKQTGLKIGVIDRNRDIVRKCPSILKIIVTGDATGNTGDSRQIKAKTFYEIICEELGLNPNSSLKLFRKNPPHAESFLQVNTWMSLHPNLKIDEIGCPELRYDILNTQATAERGIDKTAYDPHFGDTLRYFFEAALPRKYIFKQKK